MNNLVTVILTILLVLCLAAVARLLAGLRRGVLPARPGVPFDAHLPPPPVERTGRVVSAGVATLAWGVINVLGCVAWIASGAVVPRSVQGVLTACCLAVGAAVMASGGLLLARGSGWGRRLGGQGAFLLGLAAFFGIAISLLVTQDSHLPRDVRTAGPYVAAALFAHLLVTTALGTACQRAGRTAKEAELAERRHDGTYRYSDVQW
jgi:hypothetical protein